MRLALIVAAAQNNVIGRNNQLPWSLPNDLKYFKSVTMGKPVIMGRKTFESIGKPLPGRDNIVISRNPDYAAKGIHRVASLAAALELASQLNLINGMDETMVIGGAQIYAEALPLADRIYLTRIHQDINGDAWFPVLEPHQWQQVVREDIAATEHTPYDFSYIVLEQQRS